MVTVAQLVEPRFVVPVVAGSSPVGHPTSVEDFIFVVSLEQLYKSIGYVFSNENLLNEALTHPSLAYENTGNLPDNQRLEFLGDAVLQLVLTNDLFNRFPEFSEGLLTKLRSRLVSTKALEEYAKFINLGDYILLGKGEEKTGGRSRTGILADAFESLIGAIYLDSDFDTVRDFIMVCCKDKMSRVVSDPIEKNPKGELQEILQSLSQDAPNYRVISQSGPDHDRSFVTEVFWQNLVLGKGLGKSKKESESNAAISAMQNKLWL